MPVNTDSFQTKAATTLTIASGAVTAVQNYHTIAAETGVADDLDTITLGFADTTVSGVTYRPLIWLQADTGDTITVKHGTGNISLSSGADVNITGDDLLQLLYNGTNWVDTIDASSGLSSPVAIADGGTGQTTQTAAFDALAPTTTQGDVIQYGAGGDNVRLAIGTAGQLLTVVSGLLAYQSWGGRLIASGEETSDAATITISGWTDPGFTPSKFVLELWGMETDRAANYFDNVLVQFNSDTTAGNYDSAYLTGAATTAASNQSVGTVAGISMLGVAAAANSDNGVFGHAILEILHPTNTSEWTHCRYFGGLPATTASEYITVIGEGVWENTAAVTSITLDPENGTTFLISSNPEPSALKWRLSAYP